MRDYRLSPQHGSAGIPRLVAQLLLDADQLIVFGDAVGARERAGLDLAGVGGNSDVGDGVVLGFAGAMRDHGRVGGALRQATASSVWVSEPIWLTLTRIELAIFCSMP